LRAAVFIPVLELLDEAIAEPAAIDEGAALALPFRRPPCALMDRLGAAAVASLILPLLARHDRPAPAPSHGSERFEPESRRSAGP
jgi:3-hydroxyacyl-CoA dehydrogenase